MTTPTKRSFSESFATPVRCQMPRLSRNSRGATPATLTATPLETPDRFIPNRFSHMDCSQSHPPLWFSASKRQKTAMATPTPSTERQQNYEQNLRSVLLGKHTNSPERLLEFGRPNKQLRSSIKARPTRLFEQEDPYRHDVLRSLAPVDNEDDNHRRRQHQRKWSRVTMELTLALDAPNFLGNSGLLHLLGAGKDCLAVALKDKVYVWKKGEPVLELAACREEGNCWTCLQFSEDGELLAIASVGDIYVYHLPSNEKTKPIARMKTDDESEVTAMAWKGRELVCAFVDEPTTRFDLEMLPDTAGITPYMTTYEGHDGEIVSSIQWSGNVIVSCGGGVIKLFDSSRKGENIPPRRVMEHSGVKSLEFCPQQPNLLISSGEGGLKFWNTWNGKLRGAIAMVEPVTTTICSAHRHEILVAQGGKLALWSLTTKEGQKLYERSTGTGKIINMKRGLEGGILCIGAESLTMFAFRREVSKEVARAAVGMLSMPSLR